MRRLTKQDAVERRSCTECRRFSLDENLTLMCGKPYFRCARYADCRARRAVPLFWEYDEGKLGLWQRVLQVCSTSRRMGLTV